MLCVAGTLNTVAPALPLLKATAAAGRPAAVCITSSVSVLPKDAVLFTGEPMMPAGMAAAAHDLFLSIFRKTCLSLHWQTRAGIHQQALPRTASK
jgi:hypothetical protein